MMTSAGVTITDISGGLGVAWLANRTITGTESQGPLSFTVDYTGPDRVARPTVTQVMIGHPVSLGTYATCLAQHLVIVLTIMLTRLCV